jgi:spermidine synthase
LNRSRTFVAGWRLLPYTQGFVFSKNFPLFPIPPPPQLNIPAPLAIGQVEKVLHRGQSKFQTVEVVNTKAFGSLLITDGLMQSSEADEYVYHQSLVHPAMTAHPAPKKVFIAGGGEVRLSKPDPKKASKRNCSL